MHTGTKTKKENGRKRATVISSKARIMAKDNVHLQGKRSKLQSFDTKS